MERVYKVKTQDRGQILISADNEKQARLICEVYHYTFVGLYNFN